MAATRLNKPLYKDDDSSGNPPPAEPDSSAAPARPARPLLIARIGAIIVDILLLHLLLYALAKYGHPTLVHLGEVGPWIGVLVAFAYFSIGASSLSGGRTLGKFAMRLRVSETAGPDLPYAAAAKRELLLLWPLAVYIAASQIADTLTRPDELSLAPMIGLVGLAVLLGWLIGNTVHAGIDPHGRTWYDHATQSVVVSADAPHEVLHDFLRDVRENRYPDKESRARRFLWGIFLGALVLVGFLVWQSKQYIENLTPEKTQELLARQQAAYIEGFGTPTMPQSPPRDIAGDDTQTSGIWVQYVHRGPIDVETLRQNPRIQQSTDWLIAQYRKRYQEIKEERPDTPSKYAFYVSFAELTNLLFGSYAQNVYTISKSADLSAPTTGTLEAKEPASAPVEERAPATTAPATTQ